MSVWGGFTACACTGPMRGDPSCPCDMRRQGLEPTGPSAEELAAFHEALRKIFEKEQA